MHTLQANWLQPLAKGQASAFFSGNFPHRVTPLHAVIKRHGKFRLTWTGHEGLKFLGIGQREIAGGRAPQGS